MKTRLKVLLDLIGDNYNTIWDTCCDHGKLGLSVLKKSRRAKVHFVDCVPNIIKKLKNKLSKEYPLYENRANVHLSKAEDLKLEDDKSLVCICGVGGITAIDIISGIAEHNRLDKSDFLLCVQYRTPMLRSFLKKLNFKVIEEVLCFEGKWAHEIIKISINKGYNIDLVGKVMFNINDPLHLNYIRKSIKHYEIKYRTNSYYKEILDSYKELI